MEENSNKLQQRIHNNNNESLLLPITTPEIDKETFIERVHKRKELNDFVQFRNSAYWFYLVLLIVSGIIGFYFIVWSEYSRSVWPSAHDYETMTAMVGFSWVWIFAITIIFRNSWQIMYITQMITTAFIVIGISIVHLKLFVCSI